MPASPRLTEIRQLLQLAVPVAGAQIGMMLLGVVDSMMVGHMQDASVALAAVTLGHTYSFALMILGSGVLLALDPLVAQAHGARDDAAIGHWLQRGIVAALVLGVLVGGACLLAAPVLRLAGQPEEVIGPAARYVVICAPGIPGLLLFFAYRQVLQAMSVAWPVVLAVGLANGVNVLLNYALIFGHFGCPALGVEGSAWASTAGRWVMYAVILVASRRHLAPYRGTPGRHLLQLRAYRPILAIGIPVAIQVSLEVWVFSVATLLVGRMGTTALSGHQIALNLASLSFMLPVGIGVAAATRVGNAIGRRDAAGAHRAAWCALALGASVMSISATLFAVLPEALARCYTEDREIIAIAATLLPLAAVFQIFDGTQAVACGVLRGAADTRVPALVNLVGYWLFALPLGYGLAVRFQVGPRGVWWGLTVGLASVALLLVWRIRWRFDPVRGAPAPAPQR